MKNSAVATDKATFSRPKYYEMDGALRANANRAWLLAFLTIPIALLAIGFAVFVRLQPPTVIRIGPNGDASVLGKPAKGAVTDVATAGTDQFLDEAFVKRFLASYLTRGAVIAFADPRAYTDRLNQLTPSGWTRNYDVTTVSAVSRQKRDKIHPNRQSSGHMRLDDRAAGNSLGKRGAVGR